MPDPVWTKEYDRQFALQKFGEGGWFGVFIDDTGSPGMPNTPAKLHSERKSWVAVIVPPAQVQSLTTTLNEAIKALRSDLRVNEFHFVDIYAGKGPFRTVSLDKRLIIFQLFADILYVHELPIYVQTFDPDTHAAASAAWPRLPKIAACFDLHRHEDAALWVLLVRVRDHILAHRNTDEQRAMVFLDEGLKKADSCVEVDVLADAFVGGHLLFASSSSAPLLQLADFAAFCLNRTQIIIRRDKRTELDIALLRILEPLAAQYKNCTPKLGWPDNPGPMIS